MEQTSGLLPHVVVFPFPAQGHINPGLQFAYLLASSLSLCTVTFVNTSHNIAKLRAAHLDLPPCICLCSLPDDGQHGHGPDFFANVEQMGCLLESVLCRLLRRKIHEGACMAELRHGEGNEKDEDSASGMNQVNVDKACAEDHTYTSEGVGEAWCSSSSIENPKTDTDNLTTQTNDRGRVLMESMHGEHNGDGDEWPPPICIISDMFLGWVQDIADKLNIPRFVLYTPSPAALVLMLSLPEMLQQGRLPCHNALDEAHKQPLNLSGLTRTLCLADVPSHLLLPPSEFMFGYFIRQSKRIPDAAAILLNSFYELQSNAIDAARDIAGPFPTMWGHLLQKHLQFRVIPVGPLLPSCMFDGRNVKTTTLRASGAEDDTCLLWLDRQPPSSVVYVSFGSMAELAEEQIYELAWGLKASGKPFLWVARGESRRYLPPDMRMQVLMADPSHPGVTETTGLELESNMHTQIPNYLVVSWAPQLDVLKHPSTGFFLSHCGWNSTLEAVCAGIPVLGWPLFAEQKMNCRFLVDELKVAMEFRKEEGGLVRKEEVERVVREVLETEHGSHLRRRVSEWKLRGSEAVSKGGSSHENVKAFGSFLSSLGALTKT